jgi:hypothetical protein
MYNLIGSGALTAWEQNRFTLVNIIGQKWTNFTIHPLDKPTNLLPNRAEKAQSEVQILPSCHSMKLDRNADNHQRTSMNMKSL